MHFRLALLGLMATGVLSSPFSIEIPTRPTNMILKSTSIASPMFAVRRDQSGSLVADAAAQQPLWQRDSDEVRSLAFELQQTRDICPPSDPDCSTTDEEDDALLPRDYPEICFCESKEHQCLADKPEMCADPDDYLIQPPAAISPVVPKQASDPFCACATHGNGTCIGGTEYCMAAGDEAPHQPLCICAVDEHGYCKTDSTVCSDNAYTGTVRHFGGNTERNTQWCLAMVSEAGQWSPNHNLCATSEAQAKTVTSGPDTPRNTRRQDPSVKRLEPPQPNPANSSNTYTHGFGIAMIEAQSQNLKPPTAWKEVEGQCFEAGWFKMTLANGRLLDNQGRTGYIASNQQFQFDNPPQAGTIYNSGFFVKDGVLGLGGNSTWFSCSTGAFENIYADTIANYCQPVFLQMINYDGDCTGGES